MPIPPKKDNEKQADYMGRCMHKVNKDNPKMENKQQVAICLNTYNNPKKKAKANEIEVDFSEDIKKMNKVEEAPKIETKVEEATNTVPVPEVKAKEIKIEEIKAEEVKAEVDGKGEVIQTTLMQMQNQYKILHWQTMSFSQHK
jgi:hypothetical protein